METPLEKAYFHLEAEEFDKAEELFTKLFEEDSQNTDSIIGIVISKAHQSTADKSNFKASKAYLGKLNYRDLSEDQREQLVDGIIVSADAYLEKLLSVLRNEANELVKRPALDGQLYSVKQLSDTTEHLENINEKCSELTEALEFASLAYEIEKYNKNDVAFRILQLYDKIFDNIRKTPQMTGETLLDSKELTPLKEEREEWLSKSGEHKSKVTTDPTDSSGCLVLIAGFMALCSFLLVAVFGVL